RVLLSSQPAAPDSRPSLRPRVTQDAALTRLNVRVPDHLIRRHKAGLELLIEEMSREYIDDARIAYLVALAECECGPATPTLSSRASSEGPGREGLDARVCRPTHAGPSLRSG
ncbi:MAG: hypothetical protein ACXW31_15665, partial [Thermoanaerobaculia bacterium]